MIAQLCCPLARELQHIFLGSEMQATRWAGFNASWLQSFTDAVGAKRALVDALGNAVQLGNIERASRDAIPAADAMILLKVNDAIRVLDNRAVCGTSLQASWLGAVHALVLAHQQHHVTVLSLVFVE
jgi:hypothetical protein